MFAFGSSPLALMPPARIRAMIAEAALQAAEFRFFSAADSDRTAGEINADIWQGSGFERRRTGLPKLVYAIRYPVRAEEYELDSWLRERTTIVVNRGLDKIEQARLFERSSLAAHAIHSRLLSADGMRDELHDWLTVHGGGVVKAIDGNRGGRIYFAVPNGAAWRFTAPSKPPLEGTLRDVVDAILAAIGGRASYRRFMVQRFVESKDRDLAMTLRIDVHKKPDGDFGVTRTCAQLNVVGGLATNIFGGGALLALEPFLARHAPGRDKQIFSAATSLSCQVAEAIDGVPGNSIMELGVDLALDPADHLWIIETNNFPDAYLTEHERAQHLVTYLLSQERRVAAASENA